MKANRKFIDGEEAVSAVIGVILMVAITVAIAATVYVYVSGMMDVTGGTAPVAVIQIEDSGTDTADPVTGLYGAAEEVLVLEHFSGDLITMSDITIEYKGETVITTWTPLTAASTTAGALVATLPDIFQFGDEIIVSTWDAAAENGAYFFRIRHNPSNSWIVTEKAATAI